MIKILITGDYCPQNETGKLLDDKQYKYVFNDFLSVIEESDYSITNLECPIIDENCEPLKTKSGVILKSNFNGLKALKNIGFNMVTLANNHFYDFGEKGVNKTITACNKLKIDFVGGGKNLKEAQNVFYKKIQNKIFSFVNFCENEFSIATETKGGSNPLNPVANYYQILEARSKADYVIVIIHGGHEHYQLPSPRMVELYRFFVDVGAHAIISHHTHCYSGSEIYNGVPIYYGLGNFLFNSSFPEKETFQEGLGVMLKFNNSTITSDVYPLIQCRENPTIRLMNINEKKNFNKKFQTINEIITNPALLEKNFEQKIEESSLGYLSIFEPYNKRLTLGLFIRNLLPSFLNKRKIIKLLGVIQSESHRDILIKVFKKVLTN